MSTSSKEEARKLLQKEGEVYTCGTGFNPKNEETGVTTFKGVLPAQPQEQLPPDGREFYRRLGRGEKVILGDVYIGSQFQLIAANPYNDRVVAEGKNEGEGKGPAVIFFRPVQPPAQPQELAQLGEREITTGAIIIVFLCVACGAAIYKGWL